MRTIPVLLLAIGLAVTAAACEDTSKPASPTAVPSPTVAASPTPCFTNQTPAPLATDIPPVQAEPTVTPDCMKVYDIQIGNGAEAKASDTITINYTGWLEDGTIFDATSKHPHAAPYQSPLGDLITGWKEGIPGMKVGGKRRLIIPPELGYGAQARSGIPANSTLIFDVELVSIP
jgi:hypothetical protein